MNTLVELVRSREDGVLYYKIKCNRHPEINKTVFWLKLADEMHRIADRINNEYNEGCYFTVE